MASPKPLLLDSAQNQPTKLLSMPSGMLFSKQLTVKSSEQINHDTKKITFTLPGGASQISGVPAGCELPDHLQNPQSLMFEKLPS